MARRSGARCAVQCGAVRCVGAAGDCVERAEGTAAYGVGESKRSLRCTHAAVAHFVLRCAVHCAGAVRCVCAKSEVQR